jgi:hypothetical protein
VWHERNQALLGDFRRMVVAILAVGFALTWLSSPAAAQSRTWTDNTGTFTVKATFLGASGDNVTLEREDGTRLVLPLEKLSEADQKVVAALRAGKAPAEPTTPATKTASKKKAAAADEGDEPFAKTPAGKAAKTSKTGKAAKKGAPADDDDEGAADDGPRIVVPNWTRAVQLQLPAAAQQWTLAIEAPEKPAAASKGRAIALPPKLDFFEHDKGMAINATCGRAVAGYILDKAPANLGVASSGFGKGVTMPAQRGGLPGADVGQTRLVLCDLKSGKAIGQGTAPGKYVALALSDSGTQVLMAPDVFGVGDKSQVEIWSLTANGVVRNLQWAAAENQGMGGRKVAWGAFVDEERVATLAEDGLLTIWTAATAKPLLFLKIDGGSRPAISPDRKYMAFATNTAVCVLDLASGEVVVTATAPQRLTWPKLAFTPNGTRLVCASNDRIYVWDTVTGALYRDISLSGQGAGGPGESILCPNENNVLLSHTVLYNFESEVAFWTYSGANAAEMAEGTCWFGVLGPKEGGALVSGAAPPVGAEEKLAQAMKAPDFYVLKPGSTVKVNVSGLQDAAEQPRILAALSKKLQDNGCKVLPVGTIELAASTEMGKRQDMEYHGRGGGGSRSVSVQQYLTHIKFVYQGQTVWEANTSNIEGILSLKDGETLEQHLRAHERPNYDFLANVTLPKTLQKQAQGKATFGASQVTVRGIQ